MKKFCLELDSKLKHLMMEKTCFIKQNHATIEIKTDDYLFTFEQTTKISNTGNNYQMRPSRG